MTPVTRSVALGLAATLMGAAPAAADLVVLSSGRVISASSVVLTAESATIRLRGGGEVTCDRSLVIRVDPDEIPWIDPAAATTIEAAEARASRTATAAAPAPVRAVEIPAAYRAIIDRLASAHGVDARLIHAVISVDAAHRPPAPSRQGPRGLVRLIP